MQKPHELTQAEQTLIQAFQELDTAKLEEAIKEGADINLTIETGEPLWAKLMLEQFCDKDKNWNRAKAKVAQMLVKAVEYGLKLNSQAFDGYAYFFALDNFLKYGPYDLGFVDTLINLGLDPVSTGLDGTNLYEDLMTEYIFDKTQGYQDEANWLGQLCSHLERRFPVLAE